MRPERQTLKTLAESADLVNTINGGMSLAFVSRHKFDDHYVFTVKVPGVAKNSLKLELHDDHVFIFQLLHLEEGLDIPYMVACIELKSDVKRSEISANFQGKNLNIVMPFDQEQGPSEIEIQD